jgi:hypothetical protein
VCPIKIQLFVPASARLLDIATHRAWAPIVKTQPNRIIMKTSSVSVLILAAALSASALVPLSAAEKNSLPIGYRVSVLTLASEGYIRIAPGTARSTVERMMGSPFREISPDVWIYHNYRADLDLANEQHCDTLVVTFAHDRIVDLKLVNPRGAQVIAADLEHKRPELYAAAR